MSGVSKVAAERNQRILLDLVAQPGNDVCADCKTRNPRWASHNLGIFICLKCAAIHRKIGTHVTKVKSLTLDTWSKEQVDRMKDVGNLKSNGHYNPDEVKHPPPTNMIEQERDSDLEKYIRGKYEFKKYIDKSAVVAAHLGPSRSKAQVARAQTTPLTSSGIPASSTAPSLSTTNTFPLPQNKSAPAMSRVDSIPRSTSQPIPPPPVQSQQQPSPYNSSSVWNDLLSLQSPSDNGSLPLQFVQQPSPSVTASSLPLATQPANFTNPNSYLHSQPQSNPYMQQQLSMTPENRNMNFQPAYNAIGTPSPVPGMLGFNNMQPNSNNPYLNQQFSGGGMPPQLSTTTFQPQLFQQPQQFQQPILSSMPMQVPSNGGTNPFFAQQQLQPGAFMNTQTPQFTPPFGQQQQMQQHPSMYTQANPFGGWQGQEQGGFSTQQQPWG